MTSALFDAGDRRRSRFDPTRPHAIILVDPTTCPRCGARTVADVSYQDALIRHGGHGATLRYSRRYCPACYYASPYDVAEQRPPRPRPRSATTP